MNQFVPLRDQLVQVTEQIRAAREHLWDAVNDKIKFKELLKARETYLINEGLIKASNAEAREALLRSETAPERADLLAAESAERSRTLDLECLLDKRRCQENILKIEELGED